MIHFQADLCQVGEDRRASLLQLNTPDVKALAACFGGGPTPASRLQFQMNFEDTATGKGISYSLVVGGPLDLLGDKEDEEVEAEIPPVSAKGTHDPPRDPDSPSEEVSDVIDVDAASLIDLLPIRYLI